METVNLSSTFQLNGGSYPNVFKLEEVTTLSGLENIIVTDEFSENKRITTANLKAYITESPYFKSYATLADYEADKENLEMACVVGIEETDEIIWHYLKAKWNAYYEISQHYVDTLTTIGITVEELMTELGLSGIPLTLRADFFSSFIVNGEEMITGEEVFDGVTYSSVAITVPYELGAEYEVTYTLKDNILDLIADSTNALIFCLDYSPLTKLVCDDVMMTVVAEAEGYSYPLFMILSLFCFNLREVTLNIPEFHHSELSLAFQAEQGAVEFRDYIPVLNSGIFMGFPDGGVRTVKIPNGDEWGYAYEEGMTQEQILAGGYIMGLTVPADVIEASNIYEPINVERFEYGTI